MKKLFFILSVATVTLFSSCEKEQLIPPTCDCGTVTEKVFIPTNAFGGVLNYTIEADCGKIRTWQFYEIEDYMPLGIDTEAGDRICLPENYWL